MESENRVDRNQGWTYVDRISGDSAGIAVLDFYTQRYPHSSRDTWSERVATGLVRLDDRPTTSEAVVRTGQKLSYHRPPWREPEAPSQFALAYADDDLIATIKPSGLPVLPGGQFLNRTLLHLVRLKLGGHLAPLHRLGRGTSGLVLFAASPRARRDLSRDFRTGSIRKCYRALVAGTDMPNDFSVESPIGRGDNGRRSCAQRVPRLSPRFGRSADPPRSGNPHRQAPPNSDSSGGGRVSPCRRSALRCRRRATRPGSWRPTGATRRLRVSPACSIRRIYSPRFRALVRDLLPRADALAVRRRIERAALASRYRLPASLEIRSSSTLRTRVSVSSIRLRLVAIRSATIPVRNIWNPASSRTAPRITDWI